MRRKNPSLMPEIDRILLVRYSSVTLDLTKIIKQSK